jgi:cytochrome b561
MLTNTPARYHPVQVSFHWLVVVLLFAMFALGKIMAGMPNDAAKIPLLGVHIIIGFITITILIIRFIARFRLPQPAPAHTGVALFDILGQLVHYGLYVLVLFMVISGVSLSIRASLMPIVFGASGAPLPADFFVYSARALHGVTAKVLAVTVMVHIGAALYHQFILKDKLMSRMWFGKQTE